MLGNGKKFKKNKVIDYKKLLWKNSLFRLCCIKKYFFKSNSYKLNFLNQSS